MKRPAAILTASLALSLTLAGCGSPGAGTAGQQHKGTTKTAKSTELNERGNIVRRAGDTAQALDSKGKVRAEWTVTKIVTEPTCTGADSEPPENGHFVELDMQASVPNGSESDLNIGSVPIWRFIHKDGTLWNGMMLTSAMAMCVPAEERLPNSLIRGTKAQGKVIFDVPSLEGSLYYAYNGETPGWEYPIS